MKPVVGTRVMRESDAETIANKTDSKTLMKLAGTAIFQAYPWKGPVLIVAGSGNNAGDGYVLALELKKRGVDCTVLLLSNRFSSDGKYYFDLVQEEKIPCVTYQKGFDFSPYSEVADCIFGTGFSGNVTEEIADVIRAVNQSGKTVISADINSGLDGNNGQGEVAVKSDLTVSIGFLKRGHLFGRGKDLIGRVVNADIGIDLCGAYERWMEKEDFIGVIPHRPHDSHKGNYGYVTILGGCTEYAGAVKLANLSASALRAGCGVVTLAVPRSAVGAVSPYLLESTLAPIPDEEGAMLPDFSAIDAAVKGRAAVAVGMGWGKGPHNKKILSHLLQSVSCPLLIDADGLNTLATLGADLLNEANCPVILTPHFKEFERLSGWTIEEIRNDPVEKAKQFAKAHRCILLLKGTCTAVTDGEEVLLVSEGTPGMATAGSGDVLSGVLAGLLGYLPANVKTVALGAYLAGRAGVLAALDLNPVSMLASDTAKHLPKAISELF